jgi:probable F420-dependent oxidoreductase
MTTGLTPRLCIHLVNYAAQGPGDWSEMLRLARAADEAGIDKLAVSDHILFGEQLEEYARPEVGGMTDGVQPTGPDGHWLEPLTVLSVAAGLTSRIRLATCILEASLRRPAELAKCLSTLDVLSGGRLEVGVGVGWQRAEYEASGLEFDGRGQLLDETLEICTTLWREERASYTIDGHEVEGIHQMPKPLQPGGVPIWISGRVNKPVVTRLAKYGTGWIPWGDDAVDLPGGVARMRQAVAEVGGDASALRVWGTLVTKLTSAGEPDVAMMLAPLPGLVEAGVTDFFIRVPMASNDLVEYLSMWSSNFHNRAGLPYA